MPSDALPGPMLASLSEPPVVGRGLVYEPKYDGMRVIVGLEGGRASAGGRRERRLAPADVSVRLVSRNGHDKAPQFPEVVVVLTAIARRLRGPAVLDGEIVAVNASGRPLGFQHVQGRIHLTAEADIARAARDQPACLVLFDLLIDGAEDLRDQPLAARRLRLQTRIVPRPAERARVRLSELAMDDGRAMLSRARQEGWEGLIVKDASSRYASGRRSHAWRKLKLQQQQEFVVGGWTAPRQSRQHFGSLLVGYFDDRGALRWAGSVGTGFDERELARVAALLRTRAAGSSPFADAFRTAEPAHWVRPTLVVEIRFTEWTSDGLLRHPVYLGTRDDKPAVDVRREDPANPPEPAVPVRASWQRHQRVRSAGGPLAAPDLAALVARLHELEDARRDAEIALPNGDRLRVTNLAKVFWPDLRLTKGDLLRYYAAVSPYLLPAVADRPLVMKRFPNGVATHAFYQQKHPEDVPPGVRREVLPPHVDPVDEAGPRDRLIGGSLTTLLYMAQLAAISQDPWFSRVTDPLHADHVAIDLDPGEGTTFRTVVDVARWVKEEMDRLGVFGVPKTSGSRGLHIYIPLPRRTSYESGQLLCHLIATMVAEKHPRAATIERMVRRRPRGTVYVDYLQNILGKTLATAYSARASDYAGVSTPLAWQEVAPGLDPRDFTLATALARFHEKGDLWATLRDTRPRSLAAILARAKRVAR